MDLVRVQRQMNLASKLRTLATCLSSRTWKPAKPAEAIARDLNCRLPLVCVYKWSNDANTTKVLKLCITPKTKSADSCKGFASGMHYCQFIERTALTRATSLKRKLPV
jgi:hypothetical protein